MTMTQLWRQRPPRVTLARVLHRELEVALNQLVGAGHKLLRMERSHGRDQDGRSRPISGPKAATRPAGLSPARRHRRRVQHTACGTVLRAHVRR